MKQSQLKSIIYGIFSSKLIYGIQLFCNTWGIAPLDQTNRRFTAFSKEDIRHLQVLQNITLRLQTKLSRYTPTKQLLEASNSLSVHQLGALRTLTLTHKILTTKKPDYLYNQMPRRFQEDDDPLPNRNHNKITVRNSTLTISRTGLVYRGSMLWNMLPDDLRRETSLLKFKYSVKAWIKKNIPYRPP